MLVDLISVSHLSKSFQVTEKKPGLAGSLRAFFSPTHTTVHAIKDLSFSVKKGELIGFIGPNGAGKTTTLKCLSGLLHPSSGTVTVAGYVPFDRRPEFLHSISLIMGQKNQLWWDLPAKDSFVLQKELYGIDNKTYKQTLDELVTLLNVSHVLETPVRKLSLGERMKMELIAALLYRPSILFLDEPTIGLDVVMQQTLRDFVKRYNKDTGATILLTSHYMEDVKQLAERVVVIDHGRIIYDGKLADLIKTYADYKILTLKTTQKISSRLIEKYERIDSTVRDHISFKIPRKDIARVIGFFAKQPELEDLTLEEPHVEHVIREVFSSVPKNSHAT